MLVLLLEDPNRDVMMMEEMVLEMAWVSAVFCLWVLCVVSVVVVAEGRLMRMIVPLHLHHYPRVRQVHRVATFLYLFLCLMDVPESYEVVPCLADFCRNLGVPDQWMILRYLIDLHDVIPSVACYR